MIAFIDALGFVAETLDNQIKVSTEIYDDYIKVSTEIYDDYIEVGYSKGRASFSLKNIIWGWDADFAVRRVNFDNISVYIVHIITDLNKTYE